MRPYLRVEFYPSSKEDARERIIVLANEPKIITGAIVNSVCGVREEHAWAVASHKEIILPK